MDKISRRDFLKLTSMLAAGALVGDSLKIIETNNGRPNIIILLFDAMSASHMSLYGYPRETTPHLSRFAEKANVYHNCYAAGNFTTPGTASMLMGMLPWTHRAYNQGGLVKKELVPNYMPSLMGEDYYTMAFCQNPWPDRLISQVYEDLDHLLPTTAYSLRGNKLVSDKTGKDRYLSSLAFEEFLFTLNADVMGSPLLGYVYKNIALDAILKTREHPWYPRGTPEVEGFTTYINEDIFNGVYREIMALNGREESYFAYFHLFSPHGPYKPGRKYWKLFKDDGFTPVAKPPHPFGPKFSDGDLQGKRIRYDQQVAHVDAEFGNLIDRLDAEGVLENSYVVVTSDHGEIFERGFFGHGGLFLYEPAIKIPLLISSPGQQNRQDYFSPSSNTDLLPTLLAAVNKDIPDAMDGDVLPGFGGNAENDRAIFSIFAAENPAFQPISKAVIAMRKGAYKLIAYLGYPGYDGVYELYDLETDPEEVIDLSSKKPAILAEMKSELLDHLSEADQPYTHGL